MMPQSVPAMTAASALLFASILHAAPRASLKGLEQLVDATMASGMEEEHIPGAAFILVKDGAVVLAKGFGKADVKTGQPFSAESWKSARFFSSEPMGARASALPKTMPGASSA